MERSSASSDSSGGEPSESLRHSLWGQRSVARQRFGAVAVILGVIALLVPWYARASGMFSGPGGNFEALGFGIGFVLVLGILSLGLPIVAGYRNAGLIVCTAIPICPILGLAINSGMVEGTTVGGTLAGGVIPGVLIGMVGWLLGIGARSVVSKLAQ